MLWVVRSHPDRAIVSMTCAKNRGGAEGKVHKDSEPGVLSR